MQSTPYGEMYFLLMVGVPDAMRLRVLGGDAEGVIAEIREKNPDFLTDPLNGAMLEEAPKPKA